MSECNSARGKWSVPGEKPNICPACKAKMPEDRGPLRSDHAIRNIDKERSQNAALSVLADLYSRNHRKKAA